MKTYYKTLTRFISVHDIDGVKFCINIDIAENSIEWIQFNLVKSIYMVECTKDEVMDAFNQVTNFNKSRI